MICLNATVPALQNDNRCVLKIQFTVDHAETKRRCYKVSASDIFRCAEGPARAGAPKLRQQFWVQNGKCSVRPFVVFRISKTVYACIQGRSMINSHLFIHIHAGSTLATSFLSAHYSQTWPTMKSLTKLFQLWSNYTTFSTI